LSNAPGGAFAFENAPFKLTQDYIELIGGVDSPLYDYFKILLIQGFIALRKYVDDICDIVEIMSRESTLPCYEKFNMKEFKDRFKPTMVESEVNPYLMLASEVDRRDGADEPLLEADAMV
jgi:phosphatidylinositol 4-kinase B